MDQPKRSGFFHKYIAGSFSHNEHEEFVQWVQNADRAELEEAWDLFSVMDNEQQEHDQPPPSFREALEQRLDQADRPKRIHRAWWYAAAAVLAITGISIFYLLNREAGSKPSTQVATVQPHATDRKKAILTLSNGQQIDLDALPSGQLAQENGVRIQKDSNGQIQYSIINSGVNKDALVFNTISTPRGRQYQVNLPDGSTVWLNAASSLHFPVNFSGVQRKVSVTGEAFFDIKQNKNQPFIVQAGEQEVEVLGTSFNVNSYDNADIKTSLIDGMVKVSRPSNKEQVLLKPGKQSVFSKQQIAVNNFDTDIVLGWRSGLFTYYNAPLTAVMADFERWYDVEVVFEGAVPDFEFKGQIPRKFTVNQFLDVMSNYPVQFNMQTINNRQRLVVRAK